MPKAATRGRPVLMQDAKTTGNGIVLAIPSSFKQHEIIIRGNPTISTGAVQIETADQFDYSGTWAQIGGGPISLIDSTEIVVNFEGTFNFIRARISTTVVGGTVTATYEGA